MADTPLSLSLNSENDRRFPRDGSPPSGALYFLPPFPRRSTIEVLNSTKAIDRRDKTIEVTQVETSATRRRGRVFFSFLPVRNFPTRATVFPRIESQLNQSGPRLQRPPIAIFHANRANNGHEPSTRPSSPVPLAGQRAARLTGAPRAQENGSTRAETLSSREQRGRSAQFDNPENHVAREASSIPFPSVHSLPSSARERAIATRNRVYPGTTP